MATTEELLIKLKADNTDLRNKLSQSGKDVQGFQGQIQKLGGMATVAYAAIGTAVGAFMRQSYLAYEQQEKANRRLLFALNGNKQAFSELTLQASKFQSKAGIDDDVIMQVQMLGANAGHSTSMIKKLTEASVALSTITGMDLQAAYMQLAGTLNGVAGKSIPKLGTEYAALTKQQLENGDAIDLLIQKSGNLAEASATATDKLKTQWDEVKESIGGAIAPIAGPVLERLSQLAAGLSGSNSAMNAETLKRYYARQASPELFESTQKLSAANLAKEEQLKKDVKEATIRLYYSKDQDTKSTQRNTEAIDSWVAAYEKSLQLQQYDVPQVGQFAGITMGSATGKGLTIGKKSLTPRQGESPLGGAIDLTNKQLDEQIGLVNDLSGAFLDMAASGEMSMQSLSLTVLAAIRKIITAKLAEAIASQIASGSSKGLPGLALAAIGISAVMGMFSKIPKFETGGIVGGSSFSGDSITARVNSGEMILNASQQAQLFAMANGQAGGGTLVTKISANDLYFMVKRGEYLAGRNGRR